jgi:hypothetical protein
MPQPQGGRGLGAAPQIAPYLPQNYPHTGQPPTPTNTPAPLNQRRPIRGMTQFWALLAFLILGFFWVTVVGFALYYLAVYLTFFASDVDPSPGQMAFYIVCIAIWIGGWLGCITGAVISWAKLMKARNWMQ